MVIEPIFQIGKGGITDNMTEQLAKALDARELIKISVLKNTDCNPTDLLQELAVALKAEPVCAIGNKIVLYKRSKRKDFKHLEY